MAPKRRCTSCPQQLISLVRFSPQCQLTAAVGIIHRDCSCRPLSPARRSVRTRRRTAGQRPRSTRAAGPAQPNEMIRAIVLEDSLYLPHGLWRRAAHELLALWGTGIKEMTQNRRLHSAPLHPASLGPRGVISSVYAAIMDCRHGNGRSHLGELPEPGRGLEESVEPVGLLRRAGAVSMHKHA